MPPANGQPEKLPLSRGQILLRVSGAVLLTVCALMVVLGSTILVERLHGPQFIFFWGWCSLLTFAAIVLALWDMLLIRRDLKRKRQEMFRHEFMDDEFVEKLRKKKGN